MYDDKHLKHESTKRVFGSFSMPDTNWSGQPQKLAGVLILAIESKDIILSKHQTTKALIRLRGCAG